MNVYQVCSNYSPGVNKAWVKVSRIFPENAELEFNSFSDLFSVHLWAIDHLNLKLITLCLFVCFVALHPKLKAMVMAGWSVHLTTLFPGQA